MLILFEMRSDGTDGVEVRLGYVLAEAAWGKGLGGELIEGFVDWCRTSRRIDSISGGVASGNTASVRILEKNGFERVEDSHAGSGGEELYVLDLRG